MNHLIITIDLPVDERLGKLTEREAEEAAKQAYKASRAKHCRTSPATMTKIIHLK